MQFSLSLGFLPHRDDNDHHDDQDHQNGDACKGPSALVALFRLRHVLHACLDPIQGDIHVVVNAVEQRALVHHQDVQLLENIRELLNALGNLYDLLITSLD
jgi:hypothetical protein